jgi:Rap1a immunity proteins
MIVMRACLVGMVFLVSGLSASQTGTTNVELSDVHGTELLRFCNRSPGTAEFQFCDAFIVGVRDGVVLAVALRDAKPILDIPKDVKQEQMRAFVVKYLNDHPEELHKPAGLLVIFALSKAFPVRDHGDK